MNPSIRAKLLLIIAMIATVALYWPGLHGPFLFDDYGNLDSVKQWAVGQRGALLTLMPNDYSLVFSRPVAMASFMLTSWLWGPGSFSFKFGNLLVHLACGVLVFLLVRRVLRQDGQLREASISIAALLAAIWLLHPLHVSTVLYAVQRMAQLSTFFALAAVLAYLVGRRRLVDGHRTSAWLGLFIAFPALLLAGVLSKQNAVVAPFLCLAIELAYFSTERAGRSTMRVFFGVFAGLPVLGAIVLLVVSPERLLGGYVEYDFDVWQRLLTQPRALLQYIGMLLVPRGPEMGLYTDDFAVSTGLLHPATTLPAIIVLVAISGAAIRLRQAAPAFFAGWFFFLAAHGVESTFLPLEMYYEHRNYLPSIGLFLAVAGLLGLLALKGRAHFERIGSLYVVSTLAIVVLLALGTLARVMAWRDEATIVAIALEKHPTSTRAVLDQGVVLIKRQQYAAAIATSEVLRTSDNPRQRVVGELHGIAVQCMQGSGATPGSVAKAVENAQSRLSVYEVQMARLLLLATPTGECGGLSMATLAEGLRKIVDASTDQSENTSVKYTTRTATAQLYARAGLWPQAERQAQIAWKASTYPPSGALLARFYLRAGKYADAQRTIRELEARIRPYDTVGQDQLRQLRTLALKKNEHAP